MSHQAGARTTKPGSATSRRRGALRHQRDAGGEIKQATTKPHSLEGEASKQIDQTFACPRGRARKAGGSLSVC